MPSKPLLVSALSCLLAGGLQQTTASQGQPTQPRFPPPEATVPAGGVMVPIVALVPNPIVEVRVNGQGPFRFMLDTGGQGYARADVSLVKTLGLEISGQVQAGDGSGRTVPIDQVKLASIAIGDAVFKNLDALSRDYNPPGRPGGRIDGILGLQLFGGHLLTIDYLGKHVRIEHGSLPAPDGKRVFAYDASRGIVSLPLRIGAEELVADLDSGSMGALILPASVAKALPLARQPALSGQARTVAGAVDILSAPLNGDASIGSWTLRAPVLEFSNLFPKANVGSQVLREFTLTIDQRNARVRLDRPSSDPITLAPPPRRAGVGGVPTPEGFRVELVVPGGAGAKAGLEVGDIIIAIGGKPFASIPADAVGPALTSAARVELQVRRGDRTMTLTLAY